MRDKPFPMQGGPAIPWDVAEVIYRAYIDLFGAGQTLERIAERGGFGWAEVGVIGQRFRQRFGHWPEGWM